MTTSALDSLGGQLRDFLIQQFAPPPGTSTALGFLGTGIAVDASSFQNQGVFNIARVNRWLEIVADPLGSVSANGDQAGFVPWTATQLLETVYAQAITTAPAGSDERTGFNRAKSKALEGLGGSTEISTAPLDWYDPAQIPSWPSCSIGSHASAQTGTGPSEPPAPTAPIYWGWRRIANITALEDPPTRFDLRQEISDPASSVIANRRLMFANREAVTMAMPAPQLRMAAMESSLPAARINFTAASVTTEAEVSSEAAPLRIDRAPMALMVDRPVDSNQVLMLTQQVATTTGQAKTSASSSSSMVLSLKYLVVSLSRAPWWNEYFLSLQNWYVPAHKKGSLIDNEAPERKSLASRSPSYLPRMSPSVQPGPRPTAPPPPPTPTSALGL